MLKTIAYFERGSVQTLFKAGFLTCLLINFLQPVSVAQSPLEEGKKWYSQRAAEADSFMANPKNINNAIAVLEELQKESLSEEAAVLLLRSYYFKGMYTGLDEGRQKEVYQKGRELGENMAERYPKSAPIKFWYGANIGRWAETHGFLASATSGVAKKLRRLCQDIIDLDPDYQGGGGYRILAQVNFYAPKIPLVMNWPSDEKAMKLLKKAMETAPRHPSNRLLYAELLLDFDQKDKAKAHLDFLIGLKPPAQNLVEGRFVQYRARMLLKEHFGK